MLEIKQLNATKAMIAQYNAQRASVVDDTESRAELDRRKAEVLARLDAAKKELEVLEKSLKEIQSKQLGDAPTSTNDLWKEQKEIFGQIKECRAETRKVHDSRFAFLLLFSKLT